MTSYLESQWAALARCCLDARVANATLAVSGADASVDWSDLLLKADGPELLRTVWKSNFGRPTPSTRRANLTHWLIPHRLTTSSLA